MLSVKNLAYKYRGAKGNTLKGIDFMNHGTQKTSEFALDQLSGNRKFLEIISDTEIRSIHSQDASLEDIFIKVTGRELI